MEAERYISFVATSRNDDHGGNLLHRMQLFLDGVLRQCDKHRLNAELILVEWNPPPERPRFKEVLQFPSTNIAIRIIEVPRSVHSRFKYSDQLPLFQMIAKNVGIRRAAGRFVLATNIDILFSEELIRFLASRRLRRHRMYRVDRYDVPNPSGSTVEEQLEYCRDHVIRINGREATRNLLTGSLHSIYPQRTWRGRFQDWMQDFGIEPVVSYSRLHTNTCGDFTLMAKEHWFSLRGYAELDLFSFHLDSIFCHAAHHAGIRERMLRDPMRIYHIEHAEGSGFTPEGEEQLNTRLKQSEIGRLDHSQFAAWALQMRRERRPMIFNKEDWGLAEEKFAEILIGR